MFIHPFQIVKTQTQFFSGGELLWTQGFPSPRPVGIPTQNNPICPTTFPKWRIKVMDFCQENILLQLIIF